MAAQALSSIGVKMGWGLGTMTTAPSSFTQLEGCISISEVSTTQDKLDATPLESYTKQYTAGHMDTGGELATSFNVTDEFDAQWKAMVSAYNGKSSEQAMWFCAWHESRKTMNVYIVIPPASLPAPEYTVGSVLQYNITNTLVDLPDPIPAVEPTKSTGLTD